MKKPSILGIGYIVMVVSFLVAATAIFVAIHNMVGVEQEQYAIFDETIPMGIEEDIQNTEGVETILYSTDNKIALDYDDAVWETFEDNDRGIRLKGKSNDTYIGKLICKEYKQAVSQEEYLSNLVNTYNDAIVEGSLVVGEIMINNREYPLIHVENNVTGYEAAIDVLVIYNHSNQYELVFIANKKHYEKGRKEMMNVLSTLKHLQ